MKKLAVFLSVLVALFCFSACGNGCSSCNGCASCNDTSTRSFYDLDLSFDSEEMLLTGVQNFDFYNGYENAFDELKFNLYGNAFRADAKYQPIAPMQKAKAYPNGVNYGNMQVSAVLQGEKALSFSVGGTDETLLTVKLDDTVYPEESTQITIYFSLRLADVLARTGYNDHAVNLGNFYPILCGYDKTGFVEGLYYAHGDPFFSEVADYSVSITLPSEFKVASSGVLADAKHTEGSSTYSYSLENARDFAMILSKEYESLTATVDGVEINYYYYDDAYAKSSLETAKKALTTFNSLFGKYPYKTLAVCQTGFNEGGMEYPSLVMISDALGSKASYEEVIVHEVAHQWWYAVVGNDQTAYGFLDEGLAEYSVILFYENNADYGLTRSSLVDIAHKTYSTYCTVYDKVFGKKDTSMLRSLGEYDTSYEYVNIAYVKGALMFEGLRSGIGDDMFFKGLKTYFKENSFKIVTPDDLVGAFERVGANTNGFFKSWLNGEVIL